MKKLVLLMAVMLGMAFVSCDNTAKTTTNDTDSIADTTTVDSAAVDSVVVDSVK